MVGGGGNVIRIHLCDSGSLYTRKDLVREKVPCMIFLPVGPERWPSGKTGETIGLGRVKSPERKDLVHGVYS
jgi:hypothetical protein